MNFHKAKYVSSYGTSSQLPSSTSPEISFAGRSNVGKSSLLNALMYRKNLAKVSSKPGKTATINFYDVDGHVLVDLPGYGYASTSKAERGRWSELMEGYFSSERDFGLVVALIDVRHAPSQLHHAMTDMLTELGIPFCVVLTKADKLSKQALSRQKALITKALELDDGVPVIAASAAKGDGLDDLRALISQTLP
ncbi:MAG: ribosome biogenesis GTP-binding protein YihA/YsxC [Eggerthellaceae bacterium]|nr:ribosome biogenesis GTP-binding protein YihA/YsxC [Eggerthellaceae bacterium]